MDFEANFAQYAAVLRKYWLTSALGITGLIFLGYGLISFMGSSQKQEDANFLPETEAVKSPNLISVDVEGAVVKPGVYRLAFGSIIQDALVSSQGLSEDADRDFVSKNINLASKLTDGSKIYIPKVSETVTQSQITGSAVKASGLININSGSEKDLDSLPGVGPVTAQKIIDNRPYSTVDELLSKKIVTSKVFSEIKDKVTVY